MDRGWISERNAPRGDCDRRAGGYGVRKQDAARRGMRRSYVRQASGPNPGVRAIRGGLSWSERALNLMPRRMRCERLRVGAFGKLQESRIWRVWGRQMWPELLDGLLLGPSASRLWRVSKAIDLVTEIQLPTAIATSDRESAAMLRLPSFARKSSQPIVASLTPAILPRAHGR
jgi:hypothetical protein